MVECGKQSVSRKALPPLATVIMDASTLGWGSHLEELEIRIFWSPEEQLFHISLLELRETRLALKAFLPSLCSQSVQILMDNTTVMWCIKNQGGLGLSLLCREALRLWSWAQDHQICVIANHLAGVLNVRADILSWRHLAHHRCLLHPEVVYYISQLWGTPQIDLFAV